VQVTRFGPPEVLAATTVPDLVPGPGEVIIAVSVADVLLLDAAIRSGRAAAWFPITPPYVPGNGVAGQVSAVGEGVDPGWAGRAVIARTGGGGGSGGYAEQARVQAGQLVAVPGGVSLPEAAAILHDGATALGLAAGTGIRSGERVLILGAAGGLGILIGQLARAGGAQVIAAARGEASWTCWPGWVPARSWTTASRTGPFRLPARPGAPGRTSSSTGLAASSALRPSG
jgi:NADPH2:quinone reductase